MKQIKCPDCRQRTMGHRREEYAATLEHDGRAYDLIVPNVPVLVCTNCGYRTLDRDANALLGVALRQAAGLLQPDEIRNRRESLGINQKTLAEQLGIAAATLSRWETGTQVQQRGYDTLLRIYFDLADVRGYLERRFARTGTLVEIEPKVEKTETAESSPRPVPSP